MSIPPGEHEYPDLKCPKCAKIFKLPQLDIDASSQPPIYYCPNCGVKIYQPDDN